MGERVRERNLLLPRPFRALSEEMLGFDWQLTLAHLTLCDPLTWSSVTDILNPPLHRIKHRMKKILTPVFVPVRWILKKKENTGLKKLQNMNRKQIRNWEIRECVAVLRQLRDNCFSATMRGFSLYIK